MYKSFADCAAGKGCHETRGLADVSCLDFFGRPGYRAASLIADLQNARCSRGRGPRSAVRPPSLDSAAKLVGQVFNLPGDCWQVENLPHTFTHTDWDAGHATKACSVDDRS